jgi:hypothetical protein
LLWSCLPVRGRLTTTAFRNHPAIAYNTAPVHDAVTELSRRIESGEVKLEYEPVHGYLRSLLKALDVPIESQMLVFSKTSFQAPRISPTNPRAIYFNDHVSVGWVRTGEVLELLVQDPKQGSMFYTLDNSPQSTFEFKRNNVACILCHTSDATENVPGPFIGSVYPEKDGTTAYGPATTTDHRSPFETRWGGWYVLGSHKGDRHLGNAVALDRSDLASMVTPESVHLQSLEGRFDLNGYITPYSDIVALLVLEHQAHMSNLITRIGWEARVGAEVDGRWSRPPRSWSTTCCSSTKPNCRAPSRDHLVSRRCSGPRVHATAADVHFAISISKTRLMKYPVQLHDLFGRVQRTARACEGRRLRSPVGDPVGTGSKPAVSDPQSRRPSGGRGHPARHERGSS